MTIGIIGSGTMGRGIAQVAATAECQVFVYEQQASVIEDSKKKLAKIMARLIEKGRILPEKAQQIQQNISYVDTQAGLAPCDLVIEAIIENPSIKQQVFSELESHLGPDCIIASNTSSLSIASLAAACKKADRFIGIHFFNPAPLMKLVEVIPAIQTSETVLQKTKSIIEGWDKLVVVAKDTPAFIVNRIARPYYGEALRIYDEGIAHFATIDWAMKELGGFRMGPFELMDFVGNDINYTVTATVFEAFFYDARYQPSFTQKRMVEAGYLGRKSKRGFYNYSENAEQPQVVEDKKLGQYILDRIVAMLINEAADTLHYRIASKEAIETAMQKGVNYPKGLLHWADEIGIPTCVRRMDVLFEEYHETRYRCSPLLRKMAKMGAQFFNQKGVFI